MSDAVSKSAFAPVTSTHWLVSSVVDGAASVVSLVEELDVADAEVELFVDEPDGLVVLLPDEQPEIANPAISVAASNHRWAM
ncbi:hypothetical protein AAHS21_10925 [Mycobacterium sp. 050272]|uniref:hypothetical protein n=1 Tax=Mycobacterium sp. 050272 TaxID=3142488 RepID=UPI00318E9BD5